MFKAKMQKGICVLFTLLCFMYLTACGEEKTMAFSVNDIIVEKEEWAYYVKDYSSTVEVELETKYGIDSSDEGFWQNSYSDVTPQDYLRDYVVEKIARTKIEQIVAQEQGIDSPMTWSQQHKAMKEDNIERQKKYEQGEILYGKIQRDFYGYYASMIYSLRQKSIQALVDSGIITVTENEIKQLYASQKNSLDSYENLRSELKQQLIENKYKQLIDNRLSEAKIVYGNMSIEPYYIE